MENLVTDRQSRVWDKMNDRLALPESDRVHLTEQDRLEAKYSGKMRNGPKFLAEKSRFHGVPPAVSPPAFVQIAMSTSGSVSSAMNDTRASP